MFAVIDRSHDNDEVVVSNHYSCPSPLVPSEWSNLCIQWEDAVSAVNITLSGQRCGGIGEASSHFPLGDDAQSLTLTVGRGYTGLLDEIQVWHSYGSTDVTISCYNHPNDLLSGREYGLAAYWSFDEGKGRFCQDMANKGEMGKGLGIVSFDDNYSFLNSSPTAQPQPKISLNHWSASSAPIAHTVSTLNNDPAKLPITGKDASFRYLTTRLISGPSHGSLYLVSENDAEVWLPASDGTLLGVGSHFPLDEGTLGGVYYVWEEEEEEDNNTSIAAFPILDSVVYTVVAEGGLSSTNESPHFMTLNIMVYRRLPDELPVTVTWGS